MLLHSGGMNCSRAPVNKAARATLAGENACKAYFSN